MTLSVYTERFNQRIIYTPYAASFVLEVTDTTDHVLSVINTKKATLCVFTRSKTTIDELTTKEKGKILSLLALLTDKTNSNVRKTYPVSVRDKTLPLICCLALNLYLCYFMVDLATEFNQALNSCLGTLSQTVNFILSVFHLNLH